MLIIPFLILLIFFGFELTLIFKAKMGLAERLSVSFLLGLGTFTFFVFLFDWIFNIDYSLNNTLSLLISLCVVLFAVKYRETIDFFKTIKFEKKKPKLKTILFWGFIFLIVAYTLLVNLYWPISDWDALALYDFRAKAFLVDPSLIHASLSNDYFLGYPLLTSLAHLFVYQIGLPNPKFIYSLFYLSFVCIYYYSLKRHTSKNSAMAFTIILALLPELLIHSTMAYTNLAYMVYLCLGTFYLFDWIKNKDRWLLYLSAILIGLSSWVRIAEPFWIVPISAVCLTAIRNRKWKDIVRYLSIFLIFYSSWKIFSSYVSNMTGPVLNAVKLDYFSILKNVNFERLFLVTNYLYTYVFSTWGLVFLAFLVVIIVSIFKRKEKNYTFLYITMFFLIVLFIGTFGFFIVYPGWQDIPDSARRMSIFLLPLMLYSIALTTNNENK